MKLEKLAWFILTIISFVFVIKCVILKGDELSDLFVGGERICESVRYIDEHIAFNPEGLGEDVWQTPKQTMDIKSGDCEDVLLLFAHLNRNMSVPAYYCFGDIRDVNGEIQTHAWVELSSTCGDMYVIEFFSPTLSGSFIRSDEDKWDRVRHLVLTHDVFCEMARSQFRRQEYVVSKLRETFKGK